MNSKVTFKQDWERDGYLVIENASTIELYVGLNDARNHVPLKEFDLFVAFTDEQFEAGCKTIRPLREGEKYVRIGGGIYGTRDGYKRWEKYCDGIDLQIKSYCDPYEVYLYEYNNYECCINWDGDRDAIKAVANIWGWDVARKIKRLRAMYSIEELEAED